MADNSLPFLPDELLKIVLTNVPFKEWLGCCVVSTWFNATCVSLTQHLELSESLMWRHEDPVHKWLANHGQQVTSLCISHLQKRVEPALLPCPNLRQLILDRPSFLEQLDAHNGHPGLLQSLTQLTYLELSCGLPLEAREVSSLSSLVQLQHLDLYPGLRAPTCTLSGSTLPRLMQLTNLRAKLTADTLGQLGTLSALQELHLSADNHTPIGPSMVPGLAFPASLKTLLLLSRVDTRTFSAVPAGLKHLQVECDVEGPADGPDSFIACMSQLRQLTCLEVVTNSAVSAFWPVAGPAYTALTASSKLVSFYLRADLPEGVWSHVFPATRSLPHLTHLHLSGGTISQYWVRPGPPFALADLRSLVDCCPSLRQIGHITLHTPGCGLHVGELRRLTALSRLVVNMANARAVVVGGAHAEYPAVAALQELADFTQLRYLCVTMDSAYEYLTVGRLLPLTRLTALTELQFLCPPDGSNQLDSPPRSPGSEGHDDEEGDRPLDLHLKLGGQEVWLQLLECCAGDDDPSAVLCSLAHQLAEQRALVADQERRVSWRLRHQEQQIQSQQAQLQEMQAQLEALKQQRQ